jgi:hypothetical protein
MDLEDLTAALRSGDIIEGAAQHLCRSGTIDDVRRKAEELGLILASQQFRVVAVRIEEAKKPKVKQSTS